MTAFLKMLKNKSSLPIIFVMLYFILCNVLLAPQTVSPDAYLILPHLDSFSSIGDYINSLLSLTSIDIQPLRDLSLYFDLWFFKNMGVNTFIWTNFILFFISIFIWQKIASIELELNSKLHQFLWGALIACYPIYAHIISYSMARKHILSFFFISISTYLFIYSVKRSELSLKNYFTISTSFLFSIFSQPISLLFPLWTFAYMFMEKVKIKDRFFKLQMTLFVVFIFGFIVNYFYYEYSQIMQTVFGAKTEDAFKVEERFYSFFTYFYNVFYPFKLSFYSSLNIKKPFFGLLSFTFFSLLYIGITKDWRKFLKWVSYAILPLIIITTSPYNVYYTYLTIPLVAILFLLFDLIVKVKRPINYIVLGLLIGTLSIFSHFESKKWTDEEQWGQMNITRDPHCNSVTRYARGLLSKGQLPSNDILNFLGQNQCNKFTTKYNQLELIVFESQILFYSNNFLKEQRAQILLDYGKINFYPLLVLASIHIKEQNFLEAKKMIQQTLDFLGPTKLGTMYDKIFDDYLMPYCRRISNIKCLEKFHSLTIKKESTYF